jgi:hypothetical protein
MFVQVFVSMHLSKVLPSVIYINLTVYPPFAASLQTIYNSAPTSACTLLKKFYNSAPTRSCTLLKKFVNKICILEYILNFINTIWLKSQYFGRYNMVKNHNRIYSSTDLKESVFEGRRGRKLGGLRGGTMGEGVAVGVVVEAGVRK